MLAGRSCRNGPACGQPYPSHGAQVSGFEEHAPPCLTPSRVAIWLLWLAKEHIAVLCPGTARSPLIDTVALLLPWTSVFWM